MVESSSRLVFFIRGSVLKLNSNWRDVLAASKKSLYHFWDLFRKMTKSLRGCRLVMDAMDFARYIIMQTEDTGKNSCPKSG